MVMGLLGRLIRFIFWVLIVSWVIRLVGRLLGGSRPASVGATGTAAKDDPATRGKRLVKDPVCGMHLAEELALPMHANGGTQYFCSQECRAKYESSVLRRAANS
jgi:YHS domain-containing protein